MVRQCCLIGWLIVLSAGGASAQQLSVQQPVFGQFSASTTVSGPGSWIDASGECELGPVGAGHDGAVRNGLLFGQELTSSSLSVGVRIHDLRAMDEAILAGAPPVEEASPWM